MLTLLHLGAQGSYDILAASAIEQEQPITCSSHLLEMAGHAFHDLITWELRTQPGFCSMLDVQISTEEESTMTALCRLELSNPRPLVSFVQSWFCEAGDCHKLDKLFYVRVRICSASMT